MRKFSIRIKKHFVYSYLQLAATHFSIYNEEHDSGNSTVVRMAHTAWQKSSSSRNKVRHLMSLQMATTSEEPCKMFQGIVALTCVMEKLDLVWCTFISETNYGAYKMFKRHCRINMRDRKITHLVWCTFIYETNYNHNYTVDFFCQWSGRSLQ